jgi:hypothetical protein
MSIKNKALRYVIGGAVLLLVLIQFIPVERTNPPVVTPVIWDSPETAGLYTRACADCHSNQTVWPAYAYIAPVSWLVAFDVSKGRNNFNIDDLSVLNAKKLERLPDEIDELVREGEMPLPIYTPLHPAARLSEVERTALIDGLKKSLAATLGSN